MFDRLENEFRPQRAALGMRSYRQELLASNIANADTPHFKARDVDFKSALADILAGRRAGDLSLARTASAHLSGEIGNIYGAAVKYRTEYQGAVDGNTVNMDIERAAFAENAMRTEAALSFINSRFRELSAAVQP